MEDKDELTDNLKIGNTVSDTHKSEIVALIKNTGIVFVCAERGVLYLIMNSQLIPATRLQCAVDVLSTAHMRSLSL